MKKNILIACTGSVATLKLPILLQEFSNSELPVKFEIKVIATEHAKHFIEMADIPGDISVFDDQREWTSWVRKGDPVIHIELGKWADILLIAPLSANSLAKIASGICDNLLMNVVRAWDFQKPLFFCPAMNTRMLDHPVTIEQICKLKSWGYFEIPCICKTLICGDTGNGAMAEVRAIVNIIVLQLSNNVSC